MKPVKLTFEPFNLNIKKKGYWSGIKVYAKQILFMSITREHKKPEYGLNDEFYWMKMEPVFWSLIVESGLEIKIRNITRIHFKTKKEAENKTQEIFNMIAEYLREKLYES